MAETLGLFLQFFEEKTVSISFLYDNGRMIKDLMLIFSRKCLLETKDV